MKKCALSFLAILTVSLSATIALAEATPRTALVKRLLRASDNIPTRIPDQRNVSFKKIGEAESVPNPVLNNYVTDSMHLNAVKKLDPEKLHVSTANSIDHYIEPRTQHDADLLRDVLENPRSNKFRDIGASKTQELPAEEGWKKWGATGEINANGRKSEIHYQQNENTGMLADIKFIDSGARSRFDIRKDEIKINSKDFSNKQ